MQTELNLFSGEYLRDCGIFQAQLSADNQTENWSGKAFDYLRFYIKHNKQFMTEDVRISSEGIIEMPPSNRAWGGVIVRAVKSGLIKRIGFQKVKLTQKYLNKLLNIRVELIKTREMLQC